MRLSIIAMSLFKQVPNRLAVLMINTISECGWQARKSGTVIREPIVSALESVDGLTVKFQSRALRKKSFLNGLKRWYSRQRARY